MTEPSFVHLHVHSQYSLLQGAIPVDALVQRVKELGMPAVALTDLHNLFGAVDFYLEAKKAGIQPILGCEIVYVPQGRAALAAPSASMARGGALATVPKVHHLTLLCKDYAGYQNLCQMITRSYQDLIPLQGQKGLPAQAMKPLVDRELLDKWGDGLVVLSGCLRGELASQIVFGEEEGAQASLQWFKKRFGEDFFLELQDTGMPEQALVNQRLAEWGERFGVPLVATTDCHYLHPHDCEAHEVLQCIEGGKNLDVDRPKSLVPADYFLKSPAQMAEVFSGHPEALANTLRIAERCRVEFKFKDEQGKPIYHLPRFRPEGVKAGSPEDLAFDLVAYFRKLSAEGLEARFREPAFAEKIAVADWPERRKAYDARLSSELDMIARTGFAGYFLIVADFIAYAKRERIPVGPGRGSGAGSLVAYALQITGLDPLEFNLLFERFINPERISMPDFDIDFCQDRRGEVIEYVKQKYGRENVAQIVALGKLQAKAAIKDVSRVLGLSFAESDVLTKLVPDSLGITLADAIEQEPRFREKMEAEPRTAQVMKYALALEGLSRNAGVHAAGIIITEQPIVTYCPLYVGKDGGVVTQFDKDFAEAVGLIKFDFLGLKTLTVIDNAVKLIRETALPGTPEQGFELERISYKDPEVFKLIGSGDTDGIFQVESSGMKDLCLRMQPSGLEDITAINALYRPGPLGSGMVDDFIERKHGRKAMAYEWPALEPILRDTYGVILYQEQVMQIARELAGYSLGQADLLRRAMGKKKADEMAKHREIFGKGSAERGLPPEKATIIFDLLAKFADYGFNKSHSAAYGVLTYQTAFLKRYFPAEFMAALMTTEMSDTDKITKYISDCRSHQMPVLAPDVNRSQKKFSVERLEDGRKGVRFGLEAIKGVGGIAVDSMLEARAAGPFKGLMDFTRRVNTRKANKKTVESLVLAGAFDSIAEANRPTLVGSLETLLEHAGDEQEERELGQHSLFDSVGSEEVRLAAPTSQVFKPEPDWPLNRRLAFEKQVTGFYLSGHPMDAWQTICEEWLGWSTEKIRTSAGERARAAAKAARQAPAGAEYGGGEFGGGGGRYSRPQRPEVRLGGLLTEFREVMTKKGARMGFGMLEDLKGKLEVVFFPDAYAQAGETIKRALAEAEVIVVTGELEAGEATETGAPAAKILAKSVEWAAEAQRTRVQQVTLRLRPSALKTGQLQDLKRVILQHRGKCPVRIDFEDPEFRTRLELPRNLLVTASPEWVRAVNGIFGHEVVRLH